MPRVRDDLDDFAPSLGGRVAIDDEVTRAGPGWDPVLRVRHLIAIAALIAAPATPAAQTTLPSGFADQLVRGGLDFPVGMAFLPDGRLLVVEQISAKVRLLVNGSLAATDPVAVVPEVVHDGSEQGLLGIAVDPGWPARPYLYVHHDAPGARIRITRFTATGDLAHAGNGAISVDPSSAYRLLDDIPDQAANHNGGTLRFGPDGMLYAGLGEDGAACAAQDTTSLRGVILRLDVSRLPAGPGGPAAKALLAPSANPFAAHPDSNARLVWALGLRNPFRFHVAPDGSLMIADVGQSQWEEIDWATAPGMDFGWPLFEGPMPYRICAGADAAGMTAPIHAYDRSGFPAAVIGAGIYSSPVCASPGGCGFPAEYQGDYFFSDYYAGFLHRLKRSGSGWALRPPVAGQPGASDWGTGFDEVSDWLLGADGALWYCRQGIGYGPNTGQIRRIVWAGNGTPPAATAFLPPFPSPGPGYVTFRYTLARAAQVELVLFDVRGRRVRRLAGPAVQGPTQYDVTWDGRDEDGYSAPPGLYFARLRVDGAELQRRVPLVRGR